VMALKIADACTLAPKQCQALAADAMRDSANSGASAQRNSPSSSPGLRPNSGE
jgi:hypothetical protein